MVVLSLYFGPLLHAQTISRMQVLILGALAYINAISRIHKLLGKYNDSIENEQNDRVSHFCMLFLQSGSHAVANEYKYLPKLIHDNYCHPKYTSTSTHIIVMGFLVTSASLT